MLFLVFRQLDDGVEVTAEPGRGSVRLRSANRLWNDEVLDLKCELADDGLNAATWVRTLDGGGMSPADHAALNHQAKGVEAA